MSELNHAFLPDIPRLTAVQALACEAVQTSDAGIQHDAQRACVQAHHGHFPQYVEIVSAPDENGQTLPIHVYPKDEGTVFGVHFGSTGDPGLMEKTVRLFQDHANRIGEDPCTVLPMCESRQNGCIRYE